MGTMRQIIDGNGTARPTTNLDAESGRSGASLSQRVDPGT